MSDLINRADALDALRQCKKHCVDIMDSYHIDIEDAEARIRRVPSADPGLDEWCPDCKEYDAKRHCCPRFNRVIRETLADMRERGTGKWIYCEDMCGVDGYRCDKCGFHVPWDYTHKFIDFIKEYNFCPNCGADMREEKHEAN